MIAKKILLVEDEPDLAQLLAMLLRDKGGYSVFEVCTGDAAISLSRQVPSLDLLLIDVRLGVIDGKQLASKILQEHPDLPILFMSGYPMEYLVGSGILDLNDTFLRKPFSPDYLLARISRILHKGRFHAVSA